MKVEKKTVQKLKEKKSELEPVYDCVAVNSQNEQKYVYIFFFIYIYIHWLWLDLLFFAYMRKMANDMSSDNQPYFHCKTIKRKQMKPMRISNVRVSTAKKNENNKTRTSFSSLACTFAYKYTRFTYTHTQTHKKKTMPSVFDYLVMEILCDLYCFVDFTEI